MRASKFLLALLLFAAPAFAQTPPSPIVHVQLTIDGSQIKNSRQSLDEEFLETHPVFMDQHNWALVTFTIPQHWHIYWQNPGDSGVATTLEWNQLPHGAVGGIEWPTPERIVSGGSIVNYGYSDRATLLVPLAPGIRGRISVKASWLVCKDICIPESALLTATVPTTAVMTPAFKEAIRHLPAMPNRAAETHYHQQGDRIVLDVHGLGIGPLGEDTPGPVSDAGFFPVEDGVIDDDAPQSVDISDDSPDTASFTIAMKRGNAELPAVWHGVLRVRAASADYAYQISAYPSETLPGIPAPHLALILLFAFLGGLLLNLMPCVLPILSLKALALAKKAHASPREARLQSASYTAGVVVSFLLIAAVMLTVRVGGSALGWGFQLQQPEIVCALFLLMLLVSFNLFGFFELPVLFGAAAMKHDEATSLGSFLTGALAVAVATPCTAPFMAPALGATLVLPPVAALAVFAALGFGLASPFLLIGFWPRLRALLPRPGAWMKRFRQLMAFPMLATAAWLLTVLNAINGTQGAELALAGGIALGFLVWLAHGRGNKRWLLGLMLAACALSIALQPTHKGTAAGDAQSNTAFTSARLEQLRAQDQPVFVDVTASWCITCKLNEHFALHDDAVARAFAERHIQLLVADWTNSDPAITDYLATFQRNGVPLYVYYPASGEPVVLPQLLTPAIVLHNLDVH